MIDKHTRDRETAQVESIAAWSIHFENASTVVLALRYRSCRVGRCLVRHVGFTGGFHRGGISTNDVQPRAEPRCGRCWKPRKHETAEMDWRGCEWVSQGVK